MAHIAIPYFTRASFIGSADGTPGSLHDEIECYNLPYGGLGFLSNVLTYLNILLVAAGVSPLKIFTGGFICSKSSRVSACWAAPILPVASLLFTVPIAIYTTYSCRRSWELVLIAIWRTTLTLTVNLMEIHCWRAMGNWEKSARRDVETAQAGLQSGEDYEMYGYEARDRPGRTANEITVTPKRKGRGYMKETAKTLLWALIYCLGIVVGTIGLLSLVVKTFNSSRNVKIVTGVFIGVLGIGVLCALVIGGFAAVRVGAPVIALGSTISGVAGLILGLELLVAVCGDFILAAIADNWSGVPGSSHPYIYWIYFAAKRLPMFFP
ncbi:hypothetical protein B0T26DRAFT_646628 [Lasiosphaeria miniovina]|uniref:Uncharacterized protein n=1 Tax=Lasiosphaeria miniovina TaxID=1954250 RepID=A0AA40AJ28_9PEZI|nr:uncharacterized protein B0T26DRAFT_646628 [Lasiosphaeria miniovina]KAK0716742.1 hypothetical protein B0T26DRAFT_646628 [Lasiosphaeria miniovina]